MMESEENVSRTEVHVAAKDCNEDYSVPEGELPKDCNEDDCVTGGEWAKDCNEDDCVAEGEWAKDCNEDDCVPDGEWAKDCTEEDCVTGGEWAKDCTEEDCVTGGEWAKDCIEEDCVREGESLLLQKKQSQQSAKDSADKQDADNDAAQEEEVAQGDEDAFSPSQMEEFRRLASSRASQGGGGPVGKTGFVTQIDPPRVATSISLQAPLRSASARGASDPPHIFPALKERPLTHTSSLRGARDAKTPGSAMYGGRDDDCDGAMDPTSEFSTNRRMRMNPRAFYKLSSSSRIKVTVKDRAGEFVMKPVAGRPGVVSLHGGGSSHKHHHHHRHHQHPEDQRYHMRDSKDKMALIKTITTFSTPTLSSELKKNNLVAIQKSLVGKESSRMTVRDVMAKSRDRRARLFRVQMSTGRLDDWHVPGENRMRYPSRTTTPGESSLRLGSRTERSPADPKRTQPWVGERKQDDAIRARTAPPARAHPPTPGTETPGTDRDGDSRSVTPWERARTTSPDLCIEEESEEDPTPRVSVVQLRLPDSPKSRARSSSSSETMSRSSSDAAAPVKSPRGTPRTLDPVRADSAAQDGKDRARSARFNMEKRKTEALELADQECTVQMKHLDTLRESVAVVRRWKEQDREKEEKMIKWRSRMSFAATRRGHLGKVLARV